jgi:hypothetical protein
MHTGKSLARLRQHEFLYSFSSLLYIDWMLKRIGSFLDKVAWRARRMGKAKAIMLAA